MTKIEWADVTWNPITGCTPISPGCTNCYAKRMAKRLAGRCGYPGDEPFRVTLHPERLDEPLKWKKPRRVFVCSMGELFHEDVPTWMRFEVLDIVLLIKQHTFLILTKRPANMKEFFEWYYSKAGRTTETIKNLWLGVTAESQEMADERIPLLLQTPAAVRFVSVEPILGPLDLCKWLFNLRIPCSCGNVFDTAFAAKCKHDGRTMECPACRACKCDKEERWKAAGKTLHDMPGWEWRHPAVERHPLLDWVICGGETGPGARLCHPEWVRSLRDQCHAAGVPFFFKSWGEYCYPEQMPDATYKRIEELNLDCCNDALRVGKKAAGRLLDGRTWDEFPGVG